MTPSWAVVATVDEPAPLLVAFAAHHIAQGAAEVHLFLDKPNSETVKMLAPLPQVRITRCDKAYWQASVHGARPMLHTRRQIINANVAYGRCKADWLLHCDADEFVRDGRALVRDLARQPDTVEHMRLMVAERVMPAGQEQMGIFDGIFRLPLPKGAASANELFHPVAGFLDRGLTGHPNGKALVRTGRGHELGIHFPKGQIPSEHVRSTRMLHFDGLTALHYKIKLLRRAHEKPTDGPPRHKPGRMTQFTVLRENMADPQFCDDLVTALKTLRLEQMEQLRHLGLLDERPFRPDLAGLAPDLSVARFDADLARRFETFLAEVAPGLPI